MALLFIESPLSKGTRALEIESEKDGLGLGPQFADRPAWGGIEEAGEGGVRGYSSL